MTNSSFRRRFSALFAASTLAFSVQAATSVSTFYGGDPGEGLDLEGNFLYAVNVGAPGVGAIVGDVTFTPPTAAASVTAKANAPGWGAVDFGETAEDNALERVMSSIVHMWPPPLGPIELNLAGLEPGASYKLQLLFFEACCERGFDISIDGSLEVDEFSPVQIQGGVLVPASTGVVVTYEFEAGGTSVNVSLDGQTATSPEFLDLNPILSAFTLERTSAVGDSDADGLPDDWEYLHFAGLDQSGTDDFDEDGATNAAEHAAGANPTAKDSDGDGLEDGAELNTHKTSPVLTDTDGDLFPDSEEINVSGTDPTKSDTDGDSFADYMEARLLSDPLNENSFPRKTTVNAFSGGEAGEGLDLQGVFPYAFNAGPDGAIGQIGDAYFGEELVEGLTVFSGNLASAWHNPSFGDSFEDEMLELIMSSIRWSATGTTNNTVGVTFGNLETGAAYKVQLLFAENAWMRGFDVRVNGAQIADDFSPAQFQGPGFPKDKGVVLTHSFLARGPEMTVVLDGTAVSRTEITDRNPILQAATLELVAPNEDTDTDGLPDSWEMDTFTDLSRGPDDDVDEDGLTNAEEFAANTDGNNPDTDGDTLPDGAEISTHLTDPLLRDTDGDLLADGAELNTHKTDPNNRDTDGDGLSDSVELNTVASDPLKTDTDGDGASDFDELVYITDPLVASSKPSSTQITIFTGGDPGEGLDLEGNFIYAINAENNMPLGLIGDANFTEDTYPGVTLTAGHVVSGWHDPSFGDTFNDDMLELLMASIRYSDHTLALADVTLQLDDLQVGSEYKLQLLFAEHGWPRGFDVSINGAQVLNDFRPAHYQGGYEKTNGVVVTHTFTASSNSVVVVLDGRGVTDPAVGDRNPLIQGATLELLGEGVLNPRIQAFNISGAGISFDVETVAGRSYSLEYRANLSTGTWEIVGEPAVAAGAVTTMTDLTEGRSANSMGYWRVRAND